MDSMNVGTVSAGEDVSSAQRGRTCIRRHSSQQIQRLKEFFRIWHHPDDYQRRRLSQQTGLEVKQIKSWFQNKRKQYKAQESKFANSALRKENQKLQIETLAIKESLRNLKCEKCAPNVVGESHQNLDNLRKENISIKQKVERLSNILLYRMTGKQITQELLPSMASFLKEKFKFIGIERQYWDLPSLMNETTNSSNYPFQESLIVETAATAMHELIELWRVNEPLWVKSSGINDYFLHLPNYQSRFPKINHLKGSNIFTESSKDSAILPIAALPLVHMFSDAGKWMEFFSTIVTKAKTIATVDTGFFVCPVQLMHARFHVVSPLGAPRDVIFLRCIKQLDSTTWAIVDVSYGPAALRCWKFPSGCVIKELPNKTSHVTWIEHIQVDAKFPPNYFYDNTIYGSQAYSAGKWIATLQRMSERHAFLLQPITTPPRGLDGVIISCEGRKGVMELSKRMVMKFCETLCVSEKLDYSHRTENNMNQLHFFGRKSSGQGEPFGPVLCGITSLWLPVSYQKLFHIIKDNEIRAQWDFLAHGNPVNEMAHISTSSHPENCITLLQPYGPKKANNMIILQESFIDSSEGLLVYSPMELSNVSTLISGEESPGRIPILASGFAMCSDERNQLYRVVGVGGNSSSRNGCFVTMILQMHDPDREYIATAPTLMEFTIQNIKELVAAAAAGAAH